MKIYLVGGIVRDVEMNTMLGTNIQSKDRDWVVIGSTPEEMIEQGFKKVGLFPVFLHPKTHEEYALARTEKKTGRGHKGFCVDFLPSVTLEEDLERRDLTINAIAKDPKTGEIFDPYGGVNDIRDQLLRHVSPAFIEDPLRVLRVARFAARFTNFDVADETMLEMRRIVEAGEINDLTPERVWNEIQSACSENRPSRFINVLRDCGALKVILPEVDALFGVPQPVVHHPEGCVGTHTLMVIDQAAKLGGAIEVWAALLHDIGKGTTDPAILPSHHGHEERGARMAEKICDRLKVPRKYAELSILVAEFHFKVHRILEMRIGSVLKLLEAVGAFRHPEQLDSFLKTCEADSKGRTGFENRSYPQAGFIRAAHKVSAPVQGQMFIEQGHKAGPNIGGLVTQERIRRIKLVKSQYLDENKLAVET